MRTGSIGEMRPNLIALVILLAAGSGIAADEYPLAAAVECRPRAGLPNFLAKLKGGKEVRVAYLGGSITAQEGWRPKTLAWFQKTYPEAKVSQINAAIGGTGSDLGVFRLKQDVLDHRPDLMFVEFAVNDGGHAPESIYRCMEGIVRQTWKAYPDCDICFVYTLVDEFAPTLQEGKFPRAASAMEKIADHYGIPSIHMGLKVAQLAKEGKLVFKGELPGLVQEKQPAVPVIVFSKDGVHPYPETGHELYLQSIVRSWPGIEEASKNARPHELKAAFVADNYERAQMVSIEKAKLSAGFVRLDSKSDKLAKSFVERMPVLYKADRPGEMISFKFKGTFAAVYDLLGPDCGQVRVTVDEKPAVLQPRFDSYCTYHRLATLVVGADLPEAVHSVKIELDAESPDKAAILAKRNEKMDDPKRFEGKCVYPGAILVVGELVE